MDSSSLLQSPRTYQLQMEVTTDCNLRCSYCFTITDEHTRGINNFEHFLGFLEELRAREIKYLTICGYGEITFIKGWEEQCNKILDLGIDLQITTNLARELTEKEADTLARCSHLTVSCDSADSKTFRALRKGGDLRTVLLNINRIRTRAFRNRALPPLFTISAVVLDKTVWGLKDLVDFWITSGIRQFHFCNYCKHEGAQSANLLPISQMPLEELVKIPQWIKTCLQYIKDSGASYDFDSGILDGVEEKIELLRQGKKSDEVLPQAHYTSELKEGKTRDCLFPWNYLYLHANGDIRPCCICQPIGNITKIGKLDEVLNGDAMVALRRGLLSGNPEPCCRTCPSMPWTTIPKLEQRVHTYLSEPSPPTDFSKRRQEYFELSYDPLLYQREYDSLRAQYDELATQHRRLSARSPRNWPIVKRFLRGVRKAEPAL